ncbi:MAG: M28 family peptidase [Verrucomicrobiota bacterium]
MRNLWLLLVLFFFLPGCKESESAFNPESALEKEVSGERAWQHVKELVEFGPRPAGSIALESSRGYLEETLAALGWEPRRETFAVKTVEGEVEFVNLRARYGSDRWEEAIEGVIGSHYETKRFEQFEFVGANDGGSSTGLLLELARVLALKPELASKIELVFFDGEEAFGTAITPHDGLFGSKQYAKEWLLQNPALRPRWGIVLDMVGDEDLKIRAGAQIPQASIRELAKAKEEKDYGVNLLEVQESLSGIAANLVLAAEDLGIGREVGISPDYIVDDHIPLNVVAGIPTIDLIDFDYPYWHTPGDTLERVKPESLAVTGRVTLQLVEKYLLRGN